MLLSYPPYPDPGRVVYSGHSTLYKDTPIAWFDIQGCERLCIQSISKWVPVEGEGDGNVSEREDETKFAIASFKGVGDGLCSVVEYQ